MDTPALTPETLVVSSLEPQPAHQPAHHSKPSPSFHTTMEHSTFFTQTMAPLSPPESPFNFGAAFKPTQTTIVPAPASPHFELPARCKRKLESSPPQKPQPRNVARRAQNNPYFPSIEEQERRERWNRDAARLPQPSPPLAPQEHTPPTEDEAIPALEADVATPASGPVPETDHSLSPLERKRALKIRLPERKAGEFSASQEAEGVPPRVTQTTSPLSAEAYRRAMASHLGEALRLREEEQTRRTKEDNPFRW